MTEFTSKVDAWLVIVLAGAMLLSLTFSVLLWESSRVGSLVSLTVVLLEVGLILWRFVPCKYVLEAEHLLIRSGLAAQRIPYRDITGIEMSSSFLAAPALSLQRVKISFGPRYQFQLVSPRERELFVEWLQQRVRDASTRGTNAVVSTGRN
jgi:membrane protein YdbS with pleckstrin-like domain